MPKKGKNPIKEIAEELDVFDDMLDALVELLEEKGIITHEEWEHTIKKRVSKKAELRSYRDVQFETSNREYVRKKGESEEKQSKGRHK